MTQNYIKNLKEILTLNKLSQEELAKKLDVTFVALNRWLNKKAVPHKSHIESIHNLYKQEIAYPAINEETIKDIIRKTNNLKIKNISDLILNNQQLQEDLLLEHTYNSSTIEGTTFTKRQTEAVIFDHIMIKNKPFKEHLEINNHAVVLKSIFQKNFFNHKISEDFIKILHKQLMQGVREDAGEYAKSQRGIRGLNIYLTHPTDIKEEMDTLIKSWNTISNKATIKDIANFHVQFELIHPFGDGNGRVGRLILIKQCLDLDLPPIIIENSIKMEYYDTLAYAQTKLENPFIVFLFSELQKTYNLVQKYLKK
ncbi:MAG: Fic family protein [Candidatus Margulisiibacteriota bacterium]|jgi:Fic family protein